MKLLILDLYRLIYRITNNSKLALVSALAYVTMLNIIVMYGLGALMPPSAISKIIHMLFKTPVFFVTIVLMFLINVWIMAPFKNIKKEKNKKPGIWGIIMYTSVALIIFAYNKYGNSIF